MSDWKVGAAQGLPIVADANWDGAVAQRSLFGSAEQLDRESARRGHLVYDASAPLLRGSYKLPFARRQAGRLIASAAGLRAAASRLPQTDIPGPVQTRARTVLDGYYERLREQRARRQAAGLSSWHHQVLHLRIQGQGLQARGNRLYAPAVLVKPGVLNGLLVEDEDIQSSADAWNGRPVTINHPVNRAGVPVMAGADEATWDAHVVGWLTGVEYRGQGGGLHATMILERQLLEQVGEPAKLVYRALREGRRFDVSTGYWARIEGNAGERNGKRYQGITKEIVPDHVAILPNQEGACSWQDGCGVPRLNLRQNQEEGMPPATSTKPIVEGQAQPANAADAANSFADVVVEEGEEGEVEWTAWDDWSADNVPAAAEVAGEEEEEAPAEQPVAEEAVADEVRITEPVAASALAPCTQVAAEELVVDPAMQEFTATVNALGGAGVVVPLLRQLLQQASQQREQRLQAIVAASKGQVRVEDIAALDMTALERLEQALRPQSYVGNARPAPAPRAEETEWIEYVTPVVKAKGE
jgi:hypothetical protein